MNKEPFHVLLAPYLERVAVRAGNGLSRSMNQTLRSYPQIPAIIRRAAVWLFRAEKTFKFSGVHVKPMHLYWDLVSEHDDWGVEVPVIRKLDPSEVIETAAQLGDSVGDISPADHAAFAGTVEFRRRATLPYNQFIAALTIARRIHLLAGHGRIGFHPDVRRLIATCREDARLDGTVTEDVDQAAS